jgi:lipopolysaccharide transport system ATP-binding protein
MVQHFIGRSVCRDNFRRGVLDLPTSLLEIRGSVMSDVMIRFDHVSKDYPQYHHFTGGMKQFLFNLPQAIKKIKTTRFVSLEDVSFEIKRGETFGIIGRNGAGKSTTLGLMAGVLKPSQGNVTVSGRVSPLLELGAGFHPELTGRENIYLNGILMGLTRKEVQKKAASIIEFSELSAFIDQPIRVYSSGMLARLGFSVVSSLDPEILLVDEVLAVGDITFVKKCIERMNRFRQEGVTMVLVSHAMADIQRLCDRVLWIDNHQVHMVGDPKTVIESYSSR